MKIALIPGDGIGPEVVAAAGQVLEAVAEAHDLKVETREYDLGARRWHLSGETLPDTVLEELRGHDAILLGAMGDPSVPSGVLERGLLLRLRFEFDHAVNLRPVRLYPGVSTPLAGVGPEQIDMIFVREGTEGPYCGVGGSLRRGTPQEVAAEESLNTRFGVERVIRDAFRRAAARPRRKLTLLHKTNVLVHAGSLWSRTLEAVGAEFPDVRTDYAHVDAACLYLVSEPERFDVVVTDNLFGDIVTDLGAGIAGGIGLAASGNLNLYGSAPSMFEPVHGSAPDIAGQGIADPTATVLSLALLLDHLGHQAAARQVEAAVAADLAERQGQRRPTRAIGEALANRVAAGA